MKRSNLLSAICLIALLFSGCFSFGGSYNVSGTVVDLDGNPIAGVEVVAEGEKPVIESTDAEGKFTFTGLEGSVTISAQKDGYLFSGPYTVKKQEKALEILGVVGSVDVSGEGTVQVALNENGTATLKAIPDGDWVFIRWEGSLDGNTNPASVTFDQPKNITAVFRNFYTDEGNLEWAPELLGLPEFWAGRYSREEFVIESSGGFLKMTMSPTYEYAALSNVIIPNSAVKARVTVVDVSGNINSGFWRLRLTNPETESTQNVAGGSTPAKDAVETKNIPTASLNLIQEGKPVNIEIGGNWTAGEWAVFKLEFLDAEDNAVAF